MKRQQNRVSGRDRVEHPRFQHDDLAACVCSLITMLAQDARGALIPLTQMMEADRGVPMPALCDLVFAVAVVDGSGTLGAVYFARNLHVPGAPLVLLDFDALPMASGIFLAVYRRLAELATLCRARFRCVQILTAAEHRAFAEREIATVILNAPFGSMLDAEVKAIMPSMLRELPRMAHLASGDLASGPVTDGRVKLSSDVVQKMRVAPLGGQIGYRSGDEVEWPLGVVGIALAFEDESTLRRAI